MNKEKFYTLIFFIPYTKYYFYKKNFMNLDNKTYTFDKVVRFLFIITIIIGIGYFIHLIGDVLLPFLIAWLLAYLINPAIDFIQKKLHLKKRFFPIFIVLTILVAIISLALWLIIPYFGKEFVKCKDLITNYLNSSYTAETSVGEFISEKTRELLIFFNEKDILNGNIVLNIIQKLIPNLWKLLSTSISYISGIIVSLIVFLYLIFILIDYHTINNGIRNLIPHQHRSICYPLFDDIKNSMNQYFRGQARIASIVGILFCIGFEIIGLPLGILMGIIIGFLNLVPYLQTIGIIPVAILGILKAAETGQSFWLIALYIAIVFIVVQIIQDLFLTPKIMGKATGMNPALILLSLSIWGSLLGFVGLIIALPATSLLISYYKKYIIDKNDLENTIQNSEK